MQHATDEKEKDRQHVTEEKEKDRRSVTVTESKKSDLMAKHALEKLTRCLATATPDDGKDACGLGLAITEMAELLDRFRVLHCGLEATLAEDYGDDQRELVVQTSKNVEEKILECKNRVGALKDAQGKKERLEVDQSAKEIELRCKTLLGKVDDTPATMSDSQLLDLSKKLGVLDLEGNTILEKTTNFAKCVGGDDSGRLDDLNEKLTSTLAKKESFAMAVRNEVSARDLSDEKIKNALGLKIQLPKFKGYDSVMDVYTFKTQFEKCVVPYVQKKLLPDTLKLNYLSDPALTLVRRLRDIEEIWDRLIKSYGNSRMLLQNKLGALEKLGGLQKARGEEKLIHAISEILYAMTELSELAAKYHLENELYFGGGLEKVMNLIGDKRERKFCIKNKDLDLEKRDEWTKLAEFLEDELKGCQKCLLNTKSKQGFGIQPLSSGGKTDNIRKSSDSSHKIYNTNMDGKKTKPTCHICGKDDHMSYTSPFSGRQVVSYLACQKFVEMNPRDRLKILKDKKLCHQCLSPGSTEGHDYCKGFYLCKHPDHGKDGNKFHMLVCHRHKDSPENAELLKKFKKDYIGKFINELPQFCKDIKISMYSVNKCPNIGASHVANGVDVEADRGIFMLQTIEIGGQLFNIFYDSGCGDLVCKKSAIDKLVKIGRASQELPGPITISGVGDQKTICQDGVYRISLPLCGGKEANLSGLCLNKVTGTFPVFPLGRVESDIKEHYQQFGKNPTGKLPRLPDKVGGETDIMIGIKYLKYFPKEIHKLPDGLTIYEAMFRNSDGSRGVVAGPHQSFSNDWEQMGECAYSYEVMPEVTQYRSICKLGMEVPLLGYREIGENPERDLDCGSSAVACVDVLTARRPPKNSQIFDKVENAGTEITYRCKDCRNCPECRKSDRFESISIQEEIEQTVIERSVYVDVHRGRTIAKLPFMSNPVLRLRPNEGIAMKVYQSQARRLTKCPADMDQVMKSEKKLHDLGFVEFVNDLNQDDKKMIQDSEVKYFIPWRAVWNTSSLSTPCRLVFDASQTTANGCSLNDLLAKGTNNMNKLVEILIRWSIRVCAFHTDIQKMYNAIQLDKSHWMYQLYLWDNTLDVLNPKWKVIKTLIYGVKSSGNQAECGLRKTAKLMETEHERASEIIHKDIYVDDCISGDDNPEQVRLVTDDLSFVLNRGGFVLKGITISGSDPPEHLTEDGEAIFVGGLKWFPKGDYLKLNIGDFNFSKKLRGRKAQSDPGKVPDNLTRRDCVGKVSEVFDPLGKVAPIIGGMKIDMHELVTRKLDWDDYIPDDLKNVWVRNFETIQELRNVTFNRAIVPVNAQSLKIDTLDTADASNQLVCVAIYARFQLKDGGHSCQLVFARTKIVPRDMSVPRAELLAATLNATTGHVVLTSFGKYFEKSMKLTDSQIVLHWINSTRSELKLWVRNRVIEINRLTDLNTWRYVQSKDMIADLGTRKGARVEDITQTSEWVNGKAWMKKQESEFPVSTVGQITLSGADKFEITTECNKPDITDQICTISSYCHAYAGCYSGKVVPDEVKSRYKFSRYVIDPNRHRLRKIIRIIGLVYLFVKKCYAAIGKLGKLVDHPKVTSNPIPTILCSKGDQYLVTTGSQDAQGPFKCPGGLVVCLADNEIKSAMTYLFRKATDEVKEFVNKRSYEHISTVIGGMLYYTGRILPSMEQGDGQQLSDVMYDLSQSTFCVPITDKHSPIAYAIVNEVHYYHPDVKHSGVETTLRYVQQIAHVIGGRDLVKRYGKNCVRCRILNKNVVKVLMGPLHGDQLKIAPAFYRSQVDLFGPFDSYDNTNKRKSIKIWFVVFCCITTSAIDIRVMEDYSTESFLLAFTRFACRVGYPKLLLPDEGSQLVKGCKSMILNFTDLKHQLHSEYGVGFETCPVGAHYMHGKVERKIQQVKKSISLNMSSNRLSILQWESLVSEVTNGINNLPLGLGNKVECLENLDILTPNRLLLGRNNDRCPSGPLTAHDTFKRVLKTNQQIYDTWFQSWLTSYVPLLMDRPKWLTSDNDIKIGDVVLFLKSEKEFERLYQYGLIHAVIVGKDGNIRKVEVEYQNHNENVKRYSIRGVRELVVVHPVDEPGINAELAGITQ